MNINGATIYFNLTPNGNGGEHFAPASAASAADWANTYNTKLKALCAASEGKQRFASGAIYRYDLNDGFFDIDDSEFIDELYPTYLAVNFGNAGRGFNIFYFIDRVIFTGNGARLYVSVDYWATHIAAAAFSDITVLKTNKLLSDSVLNLYTYEQLKSPTEAGQKQYYSRRTYNMSNLAVYAVITYKERETANDFIERTILVRFSLFLNSAIPNAPTRAELLSLIEATSNIYEVTFAATQKYKSASVSKLYLDINFPTIPIKDGTQVHTLLNDGTEKTLACDLISQGYIVENYYIGDEDYLQDYPDNAPLPVVRIPKLTGYKVSVGAFGNYLELPPFIGFMGVTFERMFGYDGITYKITAAGNELDLTPNFQIAATLNRASLTTQEKVQKTLSVMSGVIGAGAQIATGGVTGAISGTLSLANTFANIKRNDKGQVLSVGDALLTFAGVIGFYNIPASDIIIGVSIDSLNAETTPEHTEAINYINANGANCSIAINTDDLLNKLNEAKPIFTGQTYGFYQLNCTVDNVPYDASEAITGEFQQGVKITFI